MKKTLKHHKNKHNDKHRNPIGNTVTKKRELPKQPKPCCENSEAVESKNIWLMKKLQEHPNYEFRAGKWILIVPKSFRRTYKRHMGHFMEYFNRMIHGK